MFLLMESMCRLAIARTRRLPRRLSPYIDPRLRIETMIATNSSKASAKSSETSKKSPQSKTSSQSS